MDTEENSTDKDAPPPRQGKPRALLLADGIYLVLVFGWMLALTPLGRDYAAMANPDLLGPVPGHFFSGMMTLFSHCSWAYLLVNLVLLYTAMVMILVLARVLGRGPWWLGSVAAVLFMANPVKTEAVLSLAGIQYLVPGIFGLGVLLVYAVCRTRTGWLGRRFPLLVYLAAILACPDTVPLFLVLVVLELCSFRGVPHRRSAILPIVFVGSIAYLVSGQWALPGAMTPQAMFVPLFLILYPIGMLPDTVAFFAAFPWAGWLCALLLAGFAVYLVRRAAHPLVTFGLLGAMAYRLLQGGKAVDPVTLSGGGALLIPAALLSLAICGGFLAIMRHPTWRFSVVRASTLLCVAAMLCQGWINVHWFRAGREVRQFQTAAAATATAHPAQPLAVVPDLQYLGTAPVMLAESVRYNTPFGVALPVRSILPLSLLPPAEIAVFRYSPRELFVDVTGLAVPTFNKAPLFSRKWWRQRHQPQGRVTLRLEATSHPFPAVRIPTE